MLENVPEFTQWALYPAWVAAVEALGYQVAPHIVDCADLGVPQHRARLFLVLTRSQTPLMLQLHRHQHVPASSFLDFSAGKWSPIEKPGRAPATLERVRNGRKRFGDHFIMPYYGKGSGLTGRDMNRPIGTITTLDRWALVRGDEMRMLSANEALAAQTFHPTTLRPDNYKLTMHMAGNAVPPLAGRRVIEAFLRGGMNAPLRRKARLNSRGLCTDCNVICDQCGIPRNKGRHDQCSKNQQAARALRLAAETQNDA